MAHQVMQVFVEDHVSPFLKTVGDMHLTFGRVKVELPPLPAQTVTVVDGIGIGGPYIKMLPSPDLTAWVAEVRRMAGNGGVSVTTPALRTAVVNRDGVLGYVEPHGEDRA